MGMSEDDRIRNKNKNQNEAFELYESLKALGYDDTYIIKYAQFAQSSPSDSSRFDMMRIIISIAQRSLDEALKKSINN